MHRNIRSFTYQTMAAICVVLSVLAAAGLPSDNGETCPIIVRTVTCLPV